MRYLVTGGAGSLGKHYVKWLVENTDAEIVVFSRDELKHFDMKKEYPNVKYIIGDIKDRASIFEAVHGCDYVVHTAALKHVSTGENQPWETIQTNVIGTKNVIDACNLVGAKMVLLSTDKAVQPVNLYGATKMCAEKLTIAGHQRVVRYGNVFGSSGSILHIFKKQAAKGDMFTITDHRMTRFIVKYDEAIELINFALMHPSGTYLPTELRAIRIPDLARAFDSNAQFTEMGIQPGEKIHELLSYSPLISSEFTDKMSREDIRKLIDETC